MAALNFSPRAILPQPLSSPISCRTVVRALRLGPDQRNLLTCIGENFFPGDGGGKTSLAGGRNKSRQLSAVGCGTIWAGQRIYHGVKWGQIIVTMREVGARQTVPHAQW